MGAGIESTHRSLAHADSDVDSFEYTATTSLYNTATNATLLRTVVNAEPSSSLGGAEIKVADEVAFEAPHGPANISADSYVIPEREQISLYVVREGDTLSEIAESFGVSVNTIKWANDLDSVSQVQVGETLAILPVSGVRHEVKEGQTLSSIVEDYGGDIKEVMTYNEISDPSLLSVGDEIIIPEGEVPQKAQASQDRIARSPSRPSVAGYYARPINGGRRTQGIHGYNAVDIAAPAGTSVFASASGRVILSKGGGWNGGYGSYVVIKHDNGTQTLYSHLSSTIVGVGQNVVQGQVIGYVGNSGRSTGPHLHFEIRGGGTNPF